MWLVSLALLPLSAWAHVRFTPVNTVLAGDDSPVLQLEIEHSFEGYALQSVSVSIPQGVVAVKPAERDGWNITIQYRPLPDYDDFVDDDSGLGNVTTVASVVQWTALAKVDDVPNFDIETFQMQVSLGCEFNDPATNTLWMGEYTLWFPTVEVSYAVSAITTPATHTQTWSGTCSGSNCNWFNAQPLPCPYTFIGPDWSQCNGYILWFGQNVSQPASPMFITATQANVIVQQALYNQAKSSPNYTNIISAVQTDIAMLQSSANAATYGIAVAGIVCAVIGIVVGFFAVALAMNVMRYQKA